MFVLIALEPVETPFYLYKQVVLTFATVGSLCLELTSYYESYQTDHGHEQAYYSGKHFGHGEAGVDFLTVAFLAAVFFAGASSTASTRGLSSIGNGNGRPSIFAG